MKRKRPLDFFQELEALSSQFFDDLEALIYEEAEEKRLHEEYWAMRRINADKARRIYPRLKWLEEYSPWGHTTHIVPDFFGNIKERKMACRALHEHREIMRAFYRALYNFWMFDIPIPWGTKWQGLRYSRHRKYLLAQLKRHKRSATRRNREIRRRIREERKARKANLGTKLGQKTQEVPAEPAETDFPDTFRVLIPDPIPPND